jgi:hypothetical protein
VHFYLTVEGKGVWVLFYLFLYFVNFLLLLKKIDGGRGHGFFLFTFFL